MSFVVSEMRGISPESISTRHITESSIVGREKIAEGVENSLVRSCCEVKKKVEPEKDVIRVVSDEGGAIEEASNEVKIKSEEIRNIGVVNFQDPQADVSKEEVEKKVEPQLHVTGVASDEGGSIEEASNEVKITSEEIRNIEVVNYQESQADVSKEEVEKTVEEHVNLESVPSDQGGEIEILSNVVNSEVEEIVNIGLVSFKESQPDVSKKPSWIVTVNGVEECMHCKCEVDSRYHVHEMGAKHRKHTKGDERQEVYTLDYLRRSILREVGENVAVYFVTKENVHILHKNDLTTMFGSLHVTIAYRMKEGILADLCIGTGGAVVVFTREIIEMANKKKEFAVVKKLLESDDSVKSGYDLWLFAFVMYKYKGIRCNSLNDIGMSIGRKKNPSEKRKYNFMYKELVDNAITAHSIEKVGVDDEMELLFLKNTPRVLLSQVAKLTRGISEVKLEQERAVKLTKYIEPTLGSNERSVQVKSPNYSERLRHRTTVKLYKDGETVSGDVRKAPEFPRAMIDISKEGRNMDILKMFVEETEISRKFERNFGLEQIRVYCCKLGKRVAIPPSFFSKDLYAEETKTVECG